MNFFTVSLFGEKEIDDLRRLEDMLFYVVNDLIRTKPHVSFLIGRMGEFDEYAASLIKRVQSEAKKPGSLTLVLPYSVGNMEDYEKYYDSVIIPTELQRAHHKSPLTQKNRYMIDRSDLVIVYAEDSEGDVYAAMKYAQKLNIPIINLYNCAPFRSHSE